MTSSLWASALPQCEMGSNRCQALRLEPLPRSDSSVSPPRVLWGNTVTGPTSPMGHAGRGEAGNVGQVAHGETRGPRHGGQTRRAREARMRHGLKAQPDAWGPA